MHLCMQDYQKGGKLWCYHQLTWVRLTRFILSKKNLSSEQRSLSADGSTIMSLSCFTRRMVKL
jgi:hypothetical protein